MKFSKKLLSVILVMTLCFGLFPATVSADKISDTKKEKEALEKEKKEAQKEAQALASELDKVLDELQETEDELIEKEVQINEAETKLVYAKADENDQYIAMKARIKYMYENGSESYIEILVSADSMSDLLNKAQFIEAISAKDRELLNEYQAIRMRIEEEEKALEAEYAELEVLQDKLEEKQDKVSALLKEKNLQISDLEGKIKNTAEKLKKLIKEAEEAERRRKEAEAAKKAAEAAKKAAQAGKGSGTSSGASDKIVTSGSGKLGYPIGNPRITSGFGYRVAPTAGATSYHAGIDFGASTGTPIYASEAGTVITAQYNSARGYYIVINHGNGLQTWYQHCSAMYVSVGQTVKKGQNIAAVGSTGIVTGPHLHYEVHLNGTPVNPKNYL